MSTTPPVSARRERIFLPESFVVGEWEKIQPWFEKLLEEEPVTVADLEAWMLKVSELESVLMEERAWRFIRMTCDTGNESHGKKLQDFTENILPQIVRYDQKLILKLYHNPAFGELDKVKYVTLIRSVRNRIELYREENIPLMTEDQTTAREFDQIAGGLSIEHNGEKITLQRAAQLLESRDRDLRESVWRKVHNARHANREKLDDLFSRLISLRTRIARNAGFDSFSDYQFKSLERFDYSRDDCFRFHHTVETAVRPLYEKILQQRKDRLGLDSLRPWDLSVDVTGQDPLRPFAGAQELIDKTAEVFNRLDPELGRHVRTLEKMGQLDLESRLGKAPGGYNYTLPELGIPFIFMNAVGTQGDVVTMLHEGGHAVHSFATRDLRMREFRQLPSEVAELASMAMEFISMDHWDAFYEDEQALRRAKRDQIIRPFTLLPWIAAIDAFQHWAYDHPEHDAAQRAENWSRIFTTHHGDSVNWTGLEAYQRTLWQKQGHIYDTPFYYIEYGIAQLGALAVWRHYRENPKKGLEDYLKALKMGYTAPIPEIYKAAGIRFDFSESYIRELCAFVEEELEAIGEA